MPKDDSNYNKDGINRMIMKFHREGYSQREIISLLSENGITTKKERDYSCGTIHNIIHKYKDAVKSEFTDKPDITIVAVYFDYPREAAFKNKYLSPVKSARKSILDLSREVEGLKNYFKTEDDYDDNLKRYKATCEKLVYSNGFEVDTDVYNKKDYFNRNFVAILFEKEICSAEQDAASSTEEFFCLKKDLLKMPEIMSLSAVWSYDKKLKLKIIREKKHPGKVRLKFEFDRDEYTIDNYIRYVYYFDGAEEKIINGAACIKKYSKDYFYVLQKRKNKEVLVKRRVPGYVEKPSTGIPDCAKNDKYIMLYHEIKETENRENEKLTWINSLEIRFGVSLKDEPEEFEKSFKRLYGI